MKILDPALYKLCDLEQITWSLRVNKIEEPRNRTLSSSEMIRNDSDNCVWEGDQSCELLESSQKVSRILISDQWKSGLNQMSSQVTWQSLIWWLPMSQRLRSSPGVPQNHWHYPGVAENLGLFPEDPAEKAAWILRRTGFSPENVKKHVNRRYVHLLPKGEDTLRIKFLC